MKTQQEYIDEALDQVAPNATKEEKERLHEIVKKLAFEGGSVADILGITPQMKDILHSQAHRLYKSGQFKQASVAFALLTLVDPTNYTYAFCLAAAHHMLKNYIKAAISYKACFYMDMTNPEPLFYMADCYARMNEPELAIFNIELAKNLAGNDPKYASLVDSSQIIQDKLLDNMKKFVAEGEAKFGEKE